MPQIIPIVINDGQSTPAAHTFSPKMVKDGMTSMFEEAVGVPVLRRTMALTVRPPVGGNGMYRVKFEVASPLGATDPVTGAVTVRGVNRSVQELLIHESSSDVEIKNTLAFADNGLSNAFIKECITTLTPGF